LQTLFDNQTREVHERVTRPVDHSQDASEILFQDDFESGFSKWRGASGGKPASALIADAGKGGTGKALEIQSCVGGGDAFSTSGFECSAAKPCLVSCPPCPGPSTQFSILVNRCCVMIQARS
jgi:hypothetical protein